MADWKYLRNDLGSLLGHVVEECGEVLAAIGKTQRWGLNSFNPELPPEKRETNRAWILRELPDLELAIGRLKASLLYEPLQRAAPPAAVGTREGEEGK